MRSEDAREIADLKSRDRRFVAAIAADLAGSAGVQLGDHARRLAQAETERLQMVQEREAREAERWARFEAERERDLADANLSRRVGIAREHLRAGASLRVAARAVQMSAAELDLALWREIGSPEDGA